MSPLLLAAAIALATSSASTTPVTFPVLPLASTSLENSAVPPIDNGGFIPLIQNINVTSGATSTTITWNTPNQVSDSVVTFGTSTSYTATTTGNTLSLMHAVTLQNLLPATAYHFEISSTNGFGTALSGDQTFMTPGDMQTLGTTTPPNVSMITVTPPASSLDNTAIISWLTDQPTFAWIRYGTTNYTSIARADADLELEPNEDHIFLISGLKPGATYHYQIVSQNASGVWRATADATFTTGNQD